MSLLGHPSVAGLLSELGSPPVHALWCWFPPPARFAGPRVAGPKQKLSAESRVGMFSFDFCGHVLQSWPDHGGARPCLSPSAAFPPAVTRSRARSCPSDIHVPLLACPFLWELFSWRAGSSFLQFMLCAASEGSLPSVSGVPSPGRPTPSLLAFLFPAPLSLGIQFSSASSRRPLWVLSFLMSGLVLSRPLLLLCVVSASVEAVVTLPIMMSGTGSSHPRACTWGAHPVTVNGQEPARPLAVALYLGLGPRGAVQRVPQLRLCPCPTLPISPDLCRFRRS